MSMQEQDRDASRPLLLLAMMHRKEGIFPESRDHLGSRHRQQEDQQQSIKSSSPHSSTQQKWRDKRFGFMTTTSRGVYMKASKKSQVSLYDHKREQRIERVNKFASNHGHGKIPVSYPFEEDLARWSKRQRYHYKHFLKKRQVASDVTHKLEKYNKVPEQIKALKVTDFCFDLQVARWHRSFDVLNQRKLHPSRRTTPELKKLIKTQRFQKSLSKRGEKSLVSPQQIQTWSDSECRGKLGESDK
eukprot:CAMPEP_0197184362 /NCGR_PEP_ID=MMETSP1423-20130617/9716_1 /TAXON_ID=476441 /ORGANISM="Pseudo-nitzschia heimii, Strain UNC1101" /LENGTH=243 /DNA_ID=CAMNT_0042635155 /DNA_START=150 /DNA_END=881 /DNA_ORIENTATION=+